MTPYKKDSHYKLKLDPRKLALQTYQIYQAYQIYQTYQTYLYYIDPGKPAAEVSQT